MTSHDPVRFVQDLSAKLSARSRHVCMLLGAGASKASGLPDICGLQKQVLEALDDDERRAFSKQLEGRDLEQALSRVRRIEALGSETPIDGLSGPKAAALDVSVCRAIIRALTVEPSDKLPMKHLAHWAAGATYALPLEIFTVNYDLLLESALEQVPATYFDGFIGALAAGFHTDLVETSRASDITPVPASFVRLWKLHGSVNWAWTDDRQVTRLGRPVSDDQPAAIYPSDLKYRESRRVPFIVLQDRLRRALYEPETLLLVSGYSFGDDHLNEHIFDAATHRPRSEFIVFCYEEIPATLRERANITPNLQAVGPREAIIGGRCRPWEQRHSDANHVWTDGNFTLSDFAHLAKYLARSTTGHEEGGSSSSEKANDVDQATSAGDHGRQQ